MNPLSHWVRVRASLRSHIPNPTRKADHYLALIFQQAGFLFKHSIFIFTASLEAGLHWQAGDP